MNNKIISDKKINIMSKKWNKKKAILLAKELNILLTKKHWQVILIIKVFYKKYNIIPTTRMLLLSLKKEYKILLTSQDLFIMFKSTPIKNLSKIAGLPEPKICL
ncbi:TusE/DsrC/DsvC family sulfur relay protein [Buchnera aphidicola]|uniref:TusE/DsrC/DsvC family sulfur relay protein n=1 Tax=Buchnera aphidicola TaxID=9 RepID=UPI00094CC6A3|nr:TusE/DsrC/DsvC family sulfur relay protein [Buchnera aphidicola]